MKMKRVISFLICISVIFSIAGVFSVNVYAEKDDAIDKLIHDGGEATGIGLATWMMQCYIDGWDYQAGQQGWGKSDCSGTIAYYRNAGVGAYGITDMMESAVADNLPTGGDASSKVYLKTSDLPRVHGIILHHPGHVGVYLGSKVTITKATNGKYACGRDIGKSVEGNELDNSDYGVGIVMRNLDNAEGSWTDWAFACNCKYPKEGFVKFNGKVFYYKPTGRGYSEYVYNTTIEINGKKYTFNANGECTSDTSGVKFEQTTYEVAKSSGSSTEVSGTTEVSSDSSGSGNGGSTYTGEDYSAYQSSRLTVDEYDLTFDQERRIDEINKDRDRREDEARWQWVYIILSLSGILVLIYSLLLILFYYIDLFNSVTEVSLLHKLTFGRMYPVGSKDNIEHLRLESSKDGPIYATHVTIWSTFVFGVLSSALLLNMRTVVILFLNLTNWFSSLLQ